MLVMESILLSDEIEVMDEPFEDFCPMDVLSSDTLLGNQKFPIEDTNEKILYSTFMGKNIKIEVESENTIYFVNSSNENFDTLLLNPEMVLQDFNSDLNLSDEDKESNIMETDLHLKKLRSPIENKDDQKKSDCKLENKDDQKKSDCKLENKDNQKKSDCKLENKDEDKKKSDCKPISNENLFCLVLDTSINTSKPAALLEKEEMPIEEYSKGWCSKKTKLLLESMFENYRYFTNPLQRDTAYNNIIKIFESRSMDVNKQDIKKKWNNLLTSYRRIRDRRKVCGGKTKQSWPYYDSMNNIVTNASKNSEPISPDIVENFTLNTELNPEMPPSSSTVCDSPRLSKVPHRPCPSTVTDKSTGDIVTKMAKTSGPLLIGIVEDSTLALDTEVIKIQEMHPSSSSVLSRSSSPSVVHVKPLSAVPEPCPSIVHVKPCSSTVSYKPCPSTVPIKPCPLTISDKPCLSTVPERPCTSTVSEKPHPSTVFNTVNSTSAIDVQLEEDRTKKKRKALDDEEVSLKQMMREQNELIKELNNTIAKATKSIVEAIIDAKNEINLTLQKIANSVEKSM